MVDFKSMNIHYQTAEIEQFYSQHRTSWKDFYPSEQFVFERVVRERGKLGSVLDVGGAVGGLGRALAEKFGLLEYTCLDINSQAITAAKTRQAEFPYKAEFICDDIVSRPAALNGRLFDLVANMSCADWNLVPDRIIAASWDHVAPGGEMIISLRLTNAETVNDINRSYQYIQFGDGPIDTSRERANYVVMNFRDALSLLRRQVPNPSRMLAYGYWGKPSRTAVTPFNRIGFTVLALRKGVGESDTKCELLLPLDLIIGE